MPAARLIGIATYWNLISAGSAGYTFAPPTLIKCRWEDRQITYTDPYGEEHISTAVVFLDPTSNITVGDYLTQDDFRQITDPRTVSGPARIQQINKVPSLHNLQMVVKAFV